MNNKSDLDSPVSHTVARLAKCKGFESPTLHFYYEDCELRENRLTGYNGYYGDPYRFNHSEFLENWNDNWVTKKDMSRCFGCNGKEGYYETYSAPTQSYLQKWLRGRNIIIVIEFVLSPSNKFRPSIIVTTREGLFSYKKTLTNKCSYIYEEVLELALEEALKLLPDARS